LYHIRLTPSSDETIQEAGDEAQNEDNETEKKVSEKIATVELPGHRSDIRAVAISSNDEMILSTSSSTLISLIRTLFVVHC
jgi:hypothetical protein